MYAVTVNLTAPPSLTPTAVKATAHPEDLLAAAAATTLHLAGESAPSLPVTDHWVVADARGGAVTLVLSASSVAEAVGAVSDWARNVLAHTRGLEGWAVSTVDIHGCINVTPGSAEAQAGHGHDG